MSLEQLRQTTAEILAYTLLRLFPGTQLVKNSVSEIGFSYDFVFKKLISVEAFPIIEEHMRSLSKENIPIKMLDMMRENAAHYFFHHKQPIKAEEIQNRRENIVQVLQMGDFIDTCEHLPFKDSGKIACFKLQSLEELTYPFPMTRISGTAFFETYDLKKFLKLFEQAKKKDHKILGEEMGLFKKALESGPFVFLPKGCTLQKILWDYRKKHSPAPFQEIISPPLLPKALFQKLKGENYFEIANEEEDYYAFPEAAFSHSFMFKEKNVGKDELPLYFLESHQKCHPISQSNGILKNDFHLEDSGNFFCSENEAESFITSCLQFIDKTFKMFGFEYVLNLYTKNGKKLDSSEWDKGIKTLEKSLSQLDLRYTLDKEAKTFYGPMIQVKWVDSLGRLWDGPFIAINLRLQKHFELHYLGEDQKNYPITLITHSLLGSIDRLIALSVEHFSGHLPLWLAPEQVRVLPVGMHYITEAKKLLQKLDSKNIRCGIDAKAIPLKEKVRAAEKEKVPFMVILGERENKKGVIAIRSHSEKDLKDLTVEALIEFLENEILKQKI